MATQWCFGGRCIFGKLGLLALTIGAISCGSRPNSSRLNDLGTGDKSNVATKGGGTKVDRGLVKSVHLLPNTRVPKGVFVSLVNEEDEHNAAFVKELYKIIAGINADESLRPTLQLSSPTKADLFSQEISLAVLVGKGHEADYLKIVKDVESTAESLPLRMLPLAIETATADMWLQDFGAFVQVELKDGTAPTHGMIDTFRNRHRKEFDPEVFMRNFRIPLVHLGIDSDLSGQYGGNLGAMPNGTLYIGDSVDTSDRFTSSKSDLIEQFKGLGNRNALKLASNWLSVGHVDEYVTYAPSRLACDATLFYGRPLEGLKVLLEDSSDAEFALFAHEFTEVTYARESEALADPTPAAKSPAAPTRAGLLAALQSFRRSGGGSRGISTDVSDYDTSVIPPLWNNILEEAGISSSKYAAFIADHAQLLRFYVWRNLEDQQHIDKSVALLAGESACFQSEAIPQAFRPIFQDTDHQDGSMRHGGDIAHLPGMTNNLVLRDHVILPDPQVESLRRIATERFAKHLGRSRNVHFIDDAFYHSEAGEVHCGTNVLRELQIDFKF